MKYITYANGSKNTMIAWSDAEISHVGMANIFENYRIVSAGFLVLDDGQLKTIGRSESLNKNSQPDDVRLAIGMMKANNQIHGE